MPDPYVSPPGTQPADDPVRPVAGPDGGEEGTNEHGAGTEFVQTSPGGAQGGGYTMATPGTPANTDPELGHDVLVTAPTLTSFTPTTGTLGTSINVTGTNLADVTAVKVNGVPAVIVSTSATHVIFTIGAGSSTGKIELDTSDGDAVSATNLTVT